MTGFKSGASDDDPFNGDDQEDNETDKPELTGGSPVSDTATPAETSSISTGLPWLYARSGITDGRARTVQLHLQQSTLDIEQDALRDVPIDESVNKADLREAAYLVGLTKLDEVADKLREWGYDFE